MEERQNIRAYGAAPIGSLENSVQGSRDKFTAHLLMICHLWREQVQRRGYMACSYSIRCPAVYQTGEHWEAYVARL